MVVGDGPEYMSLSKGKPASIRFEGYISDQRLTRLYQNCLAVVFPSDDDLGLVPLEAYVFAKPVIAYRGGGACETVIEGVTGYFFNTQTSESLKECLLSIGSDWETVGTQLSNLDPRAFELQSEKYTKQRFRKEFISLVEKGYNRLARQRRAVTLPD